MLKRMIYWIGIVFFSCSTLTGIAGDWPMWRYDASRTAASPEDLPETLHLLWTREYPRLEPVWDDPLNQDLMPFDTVYEPVVSGKILFLGSNAYDRMTALDTETGGEKWIFHADGPVRLPPVAAGGKVYFTSDDGRLYCLDAETGTLVWQYSGVPSNEKILGNERLISTWPARGGPVVKDGVVYFASGIWPFMGVFICALDAHTGEEIWVNDSSGSVFIKQPHNSPAFAGIAPQGSLVIAGDKLLVPGGRSAPACFDLKTGEFLYYRLAENQKTGGSFVAAVGPHFVNYHRDQVVNLFDLVTGDRLIDRFGQMPVLTPGVIYGRGETVQAFDIAHLRKVEYEKIEKDSKTGKVKVSTAVKWDMDTLWDLKVDATGDLIKAGRRLYAGGKNRVTAIDLTASSGAEIAWQLPIEGTVSRLLAADGKLFVVTLEGQIHAFGKEPEAPVVHRLEVTDDPLPEAAVRKAKAILEATQIRDGYALVFGVTNGDLVEALARHSDLRIIAADSDPARVDGLRRRFGAAGLYGKRLSVLPGDPLSLQLPPYLASVMVLENREGQGSLGKDWTAAMYHSLRPYGGTLCLENGGEANIPLIKTIQEMDLPGAELVESGRFLLLRREGPLPGAAEWTHQYGDIANTVKSDDRLVKLPLGLLWFGGSSNLDVLPRHGHGPPEQVVGGRLFIEGMDNLSARDVYTGRVLWKKPLPNLGNYGVYFDDTYRDAPLDPAYNQIHIPGANIRGTNFVATQDKIYIIHGKECLVLDPATGDTLSEIPLPWAAGASEPPDWGYIGVYEDYLIAGADFVRYSDFVKINDSIEAKKRPFYNFDISSSRRLVVMNRHTGEVRWTFHSDLGFWHNGIVAGNGRLYCLDRMPEEVAGMLKRRGMRYHGTPRLLVFDISTGRLLWSTSEDVFGTWLGYSGEYDILLHAGRPSRDMIAGEINEGMIAFRGSTGDVVWKNSAEYNGPCILHGEMIIADPHAYSLLTGEQVTRRHPLTGEETPWEYSRNYGCNYSIASEYLLSFRSAAAGFFDLSHDGGTGNFGGFKSGCTSNLVAADGVLNAPDYTRTCSCSYQNQTSLALIHNPNVELWTFNSLPLGDGPIQRMGINLGAPGDRRAENGTLWLEYPITGGPSPEIPLGIVPASYKTFQFHSSRVHGMEPRWVMASGVVGVREINLTLAKIPRTGRLFTVRLMFLEPEKKHPGERVFDVAIQGKKMLVNFDIAKETGGTRRGIIKEFHNVPVLHELKITFDADGPGHAGEPVLCGIEAVAEQAARPVSLSE
ncbi:MAG: PQQ-binding-like beta-propeller repeat protein [Candidatus Omnitrophica bacterium]|nr:PQQ-binding-like beta-propeller repeat protein [Candidatus Omnitrophota bacterium]